MKLILSVVASVIVLLSIQLVSAEILGKRQPEIPVITVDQIQMLEIDPENKGAYVLVDVRSKAETDVSIIPNAITREEFERTYDEYQGKTVIVYCTVGYRSGIYTQELRNHGWNAVNYKGSILDWCNHHLPVVTQGGKRTEKVHTYSSDYQVPAGYVAVY